MVLESYKNSGYKITHLLRVRLRGPPYYVWENKNLLNFFRIFLQTDNEEEDRTSMGSWEFGNVAGAFVSEKKKKCRGNGGPDMEAVICFVYVLYALLCVVFVCSERLFYFCVCSDGCEVDKECECDRSAIPVGCMYLKIILQTD